MKPAPRPRKERRLDGPVDWKDAAVLRTFISDRGKIRARRVTGLDPKAHRQVARAIKNAREMALLPHPTQGR
ncbi:small subunit ribosomal protein S18 [Klenkia marina]|uniref:Small ribosomal subunit protein bS18 n=1 Tax=Klenkia marina TaxID=1960309 RepID=A0A1G4YQ83_9ACTN|nr:30S ribosomal protein S18 [Klenkia marina]SCX55515.1 small subunit ribosomal protein S18 [Klenkia marina]